MSIFSDDPTGIFQNLTLTIQTVHNIMTQEENWYFTLSFAVFRIYFLVNVIRCERNPMGSALGQTASFELSGRWPYMQSGRPVSKN